MEELTGIGLVLALFVFGVREFFGWLSKKNLQNTDGRIKALEDEVAKTNKSIEQIKKQTEDLHEWHDKSDQDGVKIWYVRKSLEDALKDHAEAVATLAKNAELQTQILQQLVESNKDLHSEVQAVRLSTQ